MRPEASRMPIARTLRAATEEMQRPLGLTIIAVGKLVKVVVLVVAGIVALVMTGTDPPSLVVSCADSLRIDTGNRLVHKAIEAVSGVSTKKLEEIGVGTFLYAALFAVEGIGLCLQK